MPIRSFSQTDIVLAGRARLEKPLLAMVWLATASFCLAEPNVMYLLIASAAVIANIYAVRRNREIYFPRLYVNVGIGIATLLLFAEWGFKGFGGTVEPIVAVGHYFVLTIACKLFEQKTNRDYIQLMALSILLFVPAGLICEDIWLAAAMMIFLFLACHTAMIFTVKRGIDAAAAARLAGETAPINPQKLAWSIMRDWPIVSIRKVIWTVLICVLAMGIGVFILAPRMLAKTDVFLGLRQGSATSGFTDNVQLGQQGQIVLSDRVAMRMELVGPHANQPLSEEMLYLRGKVLTKYANSTWTADKPVPSRVPLQLTTDKYDNSVDMEFSVTAGQMPTLFAPATTYQIAPADQSLNGSITFLTNGCLWFKPGVTVPGSLKYSVKAIRPPITKSQRDVFRQVEDNRNNSHASNVQVTPRVAKQASEWVADLIQLRSKTPTMSRDIIDRINLEIAQTIAAKVKERCSYSLDLSNANPSRDGVEDFLFYMKRGHCQYFASAVAVMCQSLNVNARVAIGYKADAAKRNENIYIIRDRDAHAWVEVYTDSAGWTVIEATSSAGDDQAAAASGWWRRVVSAWEDVKFFWFEKVIGYDAAARKELTAKISAWMLSVWKGICAAAHAIATWIVEFIAWTGYTLCVIIALAITICIWAIARKLEKRKVGGRIRKAAKLASPMFTRIHIDLLFVIQLLELLAKLGIRQQPGQTLMELFDEASEILGLPPAAMDSIAAVYYRWRWGRVEPRGEELAIARSQVEMIRQFLNSPRQMEA